MLICSCGSACNECLKVGEWVIVKGRHGEEKKVVVVYARAGGIKAGRMVSDDVNSKWMHWAGFEGKARVDYWVIKKRVKRNQRD